MKLKKTLCLFFIILCTFILLSDCNNIKEELILFSFESDSDLNRLHWKCGTLFSLSDIHATHGEKSLKMELYPSDYPGVSFKNYNTDWRPYDALGFDVYNPYNKSINLAIRIDDKKNEPSYQDRFNRRLPLKPGDNRIVIPFNTMVTSGSNRKIDTRHIHRFILFGVSPKSKSVIYLDNLRLL